MKKTLHYFNIFKWNKIALSKFIMTAVILYLLAAYFLIYLVDISNIFSLEVYLHNLYELTAMRSQEPIEPLLFAHIFKEAGPTEILQWLLLAVAAIYSSYFAGKFNNNHNRQEKEENREEVTGWFKNKMVNIVDNPGSFYIVFSVGLIFMLLEDAGNLRHTLTTYIPITLQYLGIENLLTDSTVIELAYFAALGGVMLSALILYYLQGWHLRFSRNLLLVGFFSYGIATIASGTRNIGNWYVEVGRRINDTIAQGAMAENLAPEQVTGYFSPAERVGFLLMDNLFEESVELVGAGALLAAVIAYTEHYTHRNRSK